MRRLAQALWWFLFVPYFWVKSLNARPFFTEDKEFTNRVNGVIALGLIFAFVVFGALNVTNLRYLLYSRVFAVGAYAVACVAAAALVNRDRERQYWPLYEAMPRSKRRAFGFAVLAILAVAIIAAMLPVEKHAPVAKTLSCPPDAEEATAQCS